MPKQHARTSCGASQERRAVGFAFVCWSCGWGGGTHFWRGGGGNHAFFPSSPTHHGPRFPPAPPTPHAHAQWAPPLSSPPPLPVPGWCQHHHAGLPQVGCACRPPRPASLPTHLLKSLPSPPTQHTPHDTTKPWHPQPPRSSSATSRPPSCVSGWRTLDGKRAAALLRLRRLVVKQRGVALSGQAKMSVEDEHTLAFVVGVEGGCPRDVFTHVMDMILPEWHPLRRGLGQRKAQGGQ